MKPARMKTVRAGLIAALLAPALGAAEAKTAGAPPRLSFNEHIQPILADNCYACHGADPGSRKAELRLDRAEYAFAPRKDGPVIVPGKPDASPLVRRIEAQDEKKIMPPPEAHKTLTAQQIALLRRWVAEGAEYQEHWAFVAPVRAKVPGLARTSAARARNDIDRFIFARLEKEKLAPAPEADRRALIRRVSLDLTGLLPTPADVDAFLADKSPEAYERVVDRLLASPRFGEHRARYWLDYVRYADTHGIHFDNYRAIWPYRDYVIRAFNTNKRFDTFIREQLAGDLLPAKNFDELAATGFMRCNLTTNEGGTVPEEVYINQTRDRVEAFGATFLGLTTGCAACHDHKFDPITQKDFYGLAAFLGNTAERAWDFNIAEPPPVLRLPTEANQPAAEFVFARRAELQAKLQARRAQAAELVTAWLASGKKPQPVKTDALELRLRFDEARGDVVKNSAPGAAVAEFKADTNPLVWGEESWFWPSARFDINTRLPLGPIGDVDSKQAFSAGGWIMLRAKPGLKNGGTGNGTLLARLADPKKGENRGWELRQEDTKFIVSLVGDSAKKNVLTVATKEQFLRGDWLHVFFTYDGSRKASGLKLYVSGRMAETETRSDTLAGTSIKTEATTQLGRRDDSDPMRETRYQDVRFYRRALAADEVARLPFEDVAAEIVARQPDPRAWTTDEAFVVVEKFFLGQIDPEAKQLAAAIAAHDTAFEALTKDGTATLIAAERPAPAYADVLKRGDYYARQARVTPATPHFLPPLSKDAPANRRGLADWLLAPGQPLFARVAVNRMWQEVFGRGLVETAGDFGIMGARPSHPELLDWLAVEFRESGWDVKAFYRRLVTSATYRQSADVTPAALERDPANRLLGRGPRFRLDAEVLRDNALFAAGLLVEKVGGPSVKPYQPPGIWEEVAMPESNTKTYMADKGEGLYRRSVYTFWKRASSPPSMETFDAPSREVVCTRRARTNTPLQAFVTMNDPQWVEAARKLGERALHAAAATPARLDFLAQTALGRALTARESAVLAKSVEKFSAHFARADSNADEIRALLAVGESPADPALPPNELATWTLVASQFLNLDEFLTK
jgi:hypothetical protein